ncbi:hypothetical protein [Priestia flexa]|uniref:hypothetical protein n=1 Tax=Priestia flexa TaxID=86664 RepID=UPI001B33E9AB|nr:hypothetical protein [Priestia flexa]
MDKKDELVYIAENTGDYLQVAGKTLDTRLEEIKLSNKEEKEIIKEKTLRTVRDKGLSLLGSVGDVISTVLNWNEEVNENITEAKKTVLLSQYFDKLDDQEEAITKLQGFLTNAQGNTIFNKILRLVDDSPPDEELMNHLSSTLKNIVEKGCFEELFEQHRYALGQMERLTPQALTILSDCHSWPLIKLGSYQSMGPKVSSDWYVEFTLAYCESKNIKDPMKRERIQHSIIELQRQGLVEAYLNSDGLAKSTLTRIGNDLVPYLL